MTVERSLLLALLWCIGCSSAQVGRRREDCLLGICLGEAGAPVLARLGAGELSPGTGYCYRVAGAT